MTTTKFPVAAAATLKKMTTRQLIDAFIETGRLIDAGTDPLMYEVRGWLMGELEARDPEAMDAFLESEDWEDEALLKYFT